MQTAFPAHVMRRRALVLAVLTTPLVAAACSDDADAARVADSGAGDASVADRVTTLAKLALRSNLVQAGAALYGASCADSSATAGEDAGDAQHAELFRIPLDGSPPQRIATHDSCPLLLALSDDARALYFASTGDDTLSRLELATGATQPLARLGAPAIGIVVQSKTLFATTQAGQLVSVELDTGATATRVEALANPTSPVADATNVYWGERDASRIRELSLHGSTPAELSSQIDDVSALTLAHGALVFSTGYVLMKAALPSGALSTLATAAGAPVLATAVDAEHCYFASYGTVWKVPLAGGEATLLAELDSPRALAVDAESIYVIDAERVVKLAK